MSPVKTRARRSTTTSAAAYVARQSEKSFQDQVIAAAKLHGYLAYHTHDSRRSQPGFPDLTLVRPGRLIFLELKRIGGKATLDQRCWIEALGTVPGVEARIITPADWDALLALLT